MKKMVCNWEATGLCWELWIVQCGRNVGHYEYRIVYLFSYSLFLSLSIKMLFCFGISGGDLYDSSVYRLTQPEWENSCFVVEVLTPWEKCRYNTHLLELKWVFVALCRGNIRVCVVDRKTGKVEKCQDLPMEENNIVTSINNGNNKLPIAIECRRWPGEWGQMQH